MSHRGGEFADGRQPLAAYEFLLGVSNHLVGLRIAVRKLGLLLERQLQSRCAFAHGRLELFDKEGRPDPKSGSYDMGKKVSD